MYTTEDDEKTTVRCTQPSREGLKQRLKDKKKLPKILIQVT
jgi:hypothetical protein